MSWPMIIAFLTLYIFWGSTYLAIRMTLESMPPFFMAGTRLMIAGGLLYCWRFWRGARPNAGHWVTATIIGACLLLGGNGGVVWAEQRVPSGLAALLVSTVPIWMALFDALINRVRPSRLVVIGMACGFLGVVVLVDPLSGWTKIDPMGVMVLVLSSISWAAGSIYARGANLPEDAILFAGMEMLMGGALLFGFGWLYGDAQVLNFSAITAKAWIALAYLIVFGSLAGYSAYVWLLHHTTVARVSTYAYINPVIAILLGALVYREPLSLRIGIAALIILTGVLLITRSEPVA